MSQIDIVVPRNAARRWHGQIADRLRALGHDVVVLNGPAETGSPLLAAVLAFERLLFSLPKAALWERATLPTSTPRHAALKLDLTGSGEQSGMLLQLDCGNALPALAGAIAAGRLPVVELYLNGDRIGRAHPMIDNRVSIARGIDDVLARVISLTVALVGRVTIGQPLERSDTAPPSSSQNFANAYLGTALPRLMREMWRRKRFRSAHWRVGYRLIDGDGVAEIGNLSGTSWTVLPDDGTHFYADPFPFLHQGRYFIFVEDLAHTSGKGVISVSELNADGVAGTPYPVLEEPYHLSYPQIIDWDGSTWMLPEASAGRELVLYRSEDFPRRWVRHTVLIADREISDATLLIREDAFWLFATDRDGGGSTSDLQVVFRAQHLEGPWIEHAHNPTTIHRNGARPGGAFITRGGTTLLPIQDGTLGYGGGLGLSELQALSDTEVRLGPSRPIVTGNGWPYPKIHTLNRMARLEVIDGIADVRK